MKKLIFALSLGMFVFASLPLAAQTVMAEPEPDFDNPRQIVVSLSEKDDKRVNAVLNNVMNIQKAYGTDNVKLAVVAYGPGIWAVLKDSPVRARVESMLLYDIEFVACGNTLDSIHQTQDNTINGVGWARAGLVEIVERRLSGWVDLTP